MINKAGCKLLLVLLISYTLTLLAYLFFVVNVLSHKSCIPMLVFSVISIIIDYAVLLPQNKYKRRFGSQMIGDLSVITLLYTLMQFFTVIFARNILKPWQYALFQSLFLALYLFSIVPKLIKK